MENLKVKTIGEAEAIGKRHFIFASHPADIKYRETIVQILMSIGASAFSVWYLEDPEQSMDETERREYFQHFDRAAVFVFPVTEAFLNEPNTARERDLVYARERGIRILPVVVEPGAEIRLNKKIGEYHCIDLTAYEAGSRELYAEFGEALGFLSLQSVLMEKIRQNFKGNIFVSYRKQNRREMHQVIDVIHADPILHSISIWYDRFLEIGEDYNRNIFREIDECDLFVMVVTPELLQPGNYVMESEYPRAVAAGKPIVCVMAEDTDTKALKQAFPGCGPCISIHKPGDLHLYIRGRLNQELLVEPEELSAQEKYYLGEAYFHGYRTERNVQRGITYLSMAMHNGYPEAYDKLSDIYYYGWSVQRDLERAILIQKEYIRTMKRLYQGKVSLQLIDTYYDLARYLGDAKLWKSQIQCREEQLEMLGELIAQGENSTFVIGKYHGLEILLADTLIEVHDYERAIRYCENGIIGLQKYPIQDKPILLLAARAYKNLAIIRYESGEDQLAFRFILQAERIMNCLMEAYALKTEDQLLLLEVLVYRGEIGRIAGENEDRCIRTLFAAVGAALELKKQTEDDEIERLYQISTRILRECYGIVVEKQ